MHLLLQLLYILLFFISIVQLSSTLDDVTHCHHYYVYFRCSNVDNGSPHLKTCGLYSPPLVLHSSTRYS